MDFQKIFIRPALVEDAWEVTRIFALGFPQSVKGIFGEEPVCLVGLEDLFRFLILAVPDAFFIAEKNRQSIGYIVAPSQMKNIWKQAFSSGFAFRALRSLLAGQYGFPLSRLPLLIKNKLCFLRIPQNWRPGLGQILSIAIDPEYRGQGVGKSLLEKALFFLQSQELKGVKLEVRPSNMAALNLYRSLDFEVVGETRDSQGTWLVMRKVFPGPP